MCRCRPEVKTPFCGRPGCEWPEQVKPQSLWKIVREQNDPLALRLSIGSPLSTSENDGYIVYRGDTKACLELLKNAVQELEKY